jgi:hypothetical protein
MPLFTLDPTKPVQTRDGRRALIKAVRKSTIEAEVQGADYDCPKAWHRLVYFTDGHYDPKGWENELDLVNKPARKVRHAVS